MSDFDVIAAVTSRDALGPDEASLLRKLRGGVALDVGCGLGVAARTLASQFAHVDAIDLSPGMIAAAKPAPNVRFAVADLFDWLDAHRALRLHRLDRDAASRR